MIRNHTLCTLSNRFCANDDDDQSDILFVLVAENKKLVPFDTAPDMLRMLNGIVYSQNVLKYPNIRDPGA
jgi:hypothetical protein